MADEEPHLTPEQVARILEMAQDTGAIIIGGQAVNLWAEHYRRRAPELAQRGPFTSKDIDFYGGAQAAATLARELGGQLRVPPPNDATPNSALVVGRLDDRTVEIDFMRVVLGVEDSAMKSNFVTLRGRNPRTGGQIHLHLLHPLDCLRSRLANINLLSREDALSLRQAAIAIDVLQLFIEDLLVRGQRKAAQGVLRDLFYLTRDGFVRGRRARRYVELNPLRAMKAFRHHGVLDSRWRSNTLARMIDRIEEMLTEQETTEDFGGDGGLRWRRSGEPGHEGVTYPSGQARGALVNVHAVDDVDGSRCHVSGRHRIVITKG